MFGRSARVLALLLLGIPLTFLLAACGIVQVETHKTYTFAFVGLPDERIDATDRVSFTYQPGEKIDLVWMPERGPQVPGSEPQKIRIEAGLVGPFSSIAEMQKAITIDGNRINGPLALAIEPLRTDNWTDKPAVTQLQVSETLKPGYYMLVQHIFTGEQTSSVLIPTGNIVHITS